MPLKKYQQKRDFKATPEPKGALKKSPTKQLLYVIQKHAASHLHYDFRLELDGVLKSWAVPKGPCLDPTVKRLAVQVEDHPYQYGSFEGIIPKGQYGGGTVMLWDEGTWLPEDENTRAALKKGDLTFELKGKKLKGRWKLIQNKKIPKNWLLIKLKDKYAKPLAEYDVELKKPKSVVSNKTIDQLTISYQKVWARQGEKKVASTKNNNKSAIKWEFPKNKIPEEISPELATLVDKPPTGGHWIHEIKFDGYRLIIIKANNKTKIFTRNKNDWTTKFPTIVKAIKVLPVNNIILDGEVVVLDNRNKSNFQLLQNSLKEHHSRPFIFYAFDILYYDSHELTRLPLLERKLLLQKILKTKKSNILRYSDHVIGKGKEMFAIACKLGLEGIISKNSQSKYLQKRTKDWLKVKCIKRQEFIIVGFTPPGGQRKYFGSLLLATYNKDKKLIYNGNVGTGFTDSSLKSLHQLLKKNISEKMPLSKRPPASSEVTWVKPVLVAEVEFSEWTQDNHLRHPSFKGMRSDKPAKNIVKEQEVSVKAAIKKSATLKISHPDKILYPEDEVTKADLIEYYEYIQNWMLPYVKNRLLTLVRCPHDYKKCFYQKHLTNEIPVGLYTKDVEDKANDHEDYLYLKALPGLVSLVQLGVLEIHPWGSTIKSIEKPDMLIFDLDPASEVKWKEVVKAAKLIKQQLAAINLLSFVKSTGGKGLHVVVPIKPQYDWDTIKNFSHSFVNYLVQQNPEEYVSTISKKSRQGKIFIDYLRNQRGATAVAPYSTRAREGAPIATPLAWDELTNNIKDTSFNIKNIRKRMESLKQDPWAEFYNIKQKLLLK